MGMAISVSLNPTLFSRSIYILLVVEVASNEIASYDRYSSKNCRSERIIYQSQFVTN
ncbi:hypothetical protein VIBNIFTn2_120044 [Vibrio nigripulchritudo FTn2]|nr:hypothetical protein VIBNIFTn2_120044 [Vibrio nigripulchritudo FTn2]